MAFKDSATGVARLNDYNLRDLPGTASFEVLTISGRGLAPSRDRQMQFPGDVGARDYGGKPDVRRLEVSGILYADTMPDFRLGLDKLKELARLRLKIDEILYGEAEAQTLWFADESIIHNATAQAGSSTSITLDTGASATDDYYNDMEVEIIAGTGIGQIRNIIDYVGSTKVASVSPEFATQPDFSSVFWIRDNRYYLVNYSGTMNETRITNQWMKTGYSNITLPFKAVYPFAVSDWKKENIASVNGGDFQAINTGNAPSYPKYEIKGGGASSVDAQVVETTQAFQSNFNKAEGTGILNTVITPSVSTGIKHQTGKLNQAIELDTNLRHDNGICDSFRQDTESIRGLQSDVMNYYQGSLAFWLKRPTPWEQGDDWTTAEYIFNLYHYSTQALYIYFDSLNELLRFDFAWAAGNFSTSSMIAGEWYYVVLRWNSLRVGWSTAYGTSYVVMNVYDSSGASVGNASTTSQPNPSSVASTFQIGSIYREYLAPEHKSTFAGSWDDLAIWDRTLTDSEIVTLLNGGTGARADSVGSSDLVYYADFDGTVGTDMVNPIASSNVDTASASVTTTTAVTVNGNGDKIFADNDRIVLYDETGYKVQGFVNGTPTSTTVTVDDGAGGAIGDVDKVGVSLNFDGSDDIIIIGTTGLPLGAAARSFACWMKTSDLTDTEQMLFQYGDNGTDRLFRPYFDAPDGQIRVNVYGSEVGSNTGVITDTKWHHVAITYDGAGGFIFYIDGVPEGTASSTLNTILGYYWESIGSGGGGVSPDNPFKGNLADVLLYDDELSASEVLTLATRGSHASGLVGHWKLDENTGTTANDSSASGNDGTLGGGVGAREPTWNQLAYISKNLNADGGQENGGIGGMDLTHATAGGTVVMSKLTGTDAFADAQSIRLNYSVTSGGSVYKYMWFPDITTVAGEDYVARFWFRPSGGSIGGYIVIAPWETIFFIGNPGHTDWKFYEGAFEAGGTSTRLLAGQYNTGTWDFDKVQILPNLVNNGGMEGGADPPTGWTASGYVTVTSDTDEHSGTHSCKMVSTNENQNISQAITLQADAYYEVSIWAKGGSGGETIAFYPYIGGASFGYTESTNTITTGWTRYSYTFKNGSSTSGTFYITLIGWSGTIYIDDVSIVHRPDLSPTLTPMSTNYRYEPTRLGMGYHTGGNENMVYAITGNKEQSSGRLVFRPQFPSTTGTTQFLLEAVGTATDLISVQYDQASNKFVIEKVVSSTGYLSYSVEQTFNANDEIELGWYTDPTSGTEIFVNGSASGSTGHANTASLATNPATLYVASDSTFAYQSNIIIDDLEILTKSMPAEWFAEQHTKRLASKNENLALKYTGTLDTGDVLTIDCASTKVITRAELYDASAGTSGSVVSNTTLYSSNMPILSQNKSMLYFPNTISNGVDIHYRNNYQ